MRAMHGGGTPPRSSALGQAIFLLDWTDYMERNSRAKADYYGDPYPRTPLLRATAGSLPERLRVWDGRIPPPNRGAQ